MFSDKVKIMVRAGDGGAGSAHLHREKFVPRGGPDGGDGGRGGSVYARASSRMNTLQHYFDHRHHRAESGGAGSSNRCHGKAGHDLVLDVPLGTVIHDAVTGDVLADLVEEGQRVEVARAGRGGLGNTHFATSTYQTPRLAEKGELGQERTLILELRLIADVGLVGLPNAGKSTFLSVVTAARPKIADYPFTTLSPNLGVATIDDENTLVLADIPGLIEGAHEGVGLGHEFLRHIERTAVLIHVVDASSGDADALLAAFRTINHELQMYQEELSRRPMVVAVNKMDLMEAQSIWPEVQKRLEKMGYLAFPISAATMQGLQPVLRQVWHLLVAERQRCADDALAAAAAAEFNAKPAVDADPLEIIPLPSGFRVRNRRAERIVQMTQMESEEGVDRLQKLLHTAGITQALERAGVKGGDKVWIGPIMLTWES